MNDDSCEFAGMKEIIDDLPRQLGYKEYEYAQARFEALCRETGIGDDRIGYFGSISCPGISDIDAVVIGSPQQIHALEQAVEEECNQNAIMRQTFWHRPLYLIDEILNDACTLHSLDGVRFISGGDASDIMELRGAGKTYLYLVWWTFLIIVTVGIYRSHQVSLRLLVLIQKNLETTEYYFTSLNDNDAAVDRKSEKLRAKVMGCAKLDGSILDDFWEQFRDACVAVDRYCNSLRLDESRGVRNFIPNRSTVLIGKSPTTLNQLCCLKYVNVPVELVDIGRCFLGVSESAAEAQEYVQASLRVSMISLEYGLAYPFITPFAMPTHGSQMRILKAVNKCLSVFA